MVLSELGRHAMSLSIVARKERLNPSVLRKGRGKACPWAIIRHVGKAVINWYEVRWSWCNFGSSDPGRTFKLANKSDIELFIDTMDSLNYNNGQYTDPGNPPSHMVFSECLGRKR